MAAKSVLAGRAARLAVDLPAKLDELLTAIASRHCAVETLEERGRSRLDFHDVGVNNLRAALEAAFEAGVRYGAHFGAGGVR